MSNFLMYSEHSYSGSDAVWRASFSTVYCMHMVQWSTCWGNRFLRRWVIAFEHAFHFLRVSFGLKLGSSWMLNQFEGIPLLFMFGWSVLEKLHRLTAMNTIVKGVWEGQMNGKGESIIALEGTKLSSDFVIIRRPEMSGTQCGHCSGWLFSQSSALS